MTNWITINADRQCENTGEIIGYGEKGMKHVGGKQGGKGSKMINKWWKRKYNSEGTDTLKMCAAREVINISK